jgi:hypothetical protein
MRIEYYSYQNSVLINIPPSGYWLWFNDNKIYTYGQQTRKCENGYESVYVTDVSSKEPQLLGYQCIQGLDKLLHYFSSNSSKKYLYYKKDQKKIADIFDIINIFENKKIINLDK